MSARAQPLIPEVSGNETSVLSIVSRRRQRKGTMQAFICLRTP